MLSSPRTILFLIFCATSAIPPAAAGTTQVALFTGFLASSGAGMDVLNSHLAGSPDIHDYQGMVFTWDDRDAARDWIQATPDRSALVIIGHSFGGNATLQLANNLLKPLGIDVDLTVQVDPVENFDQGWNDQLPTNVDFGINYYQISTGLFEPQGEDFVQGAVNINAEVLFNDTSITHTSIDNDPRLHDFITQNILDATHVENADFNTDSIVDGTDFLTWQRHTGTTATALLTTGDANNDHNTDPQDYTIWQQQFAQPPSPALATIPEPTAAALLLIALACFFTKRTRIYADLADTRG